MGLGVHQLAGYRRRPPRRLGADGWGSLAYGVLSMLERRIWGIAEACLRRRLGAKGRSDAVL